MNQYYLSAKIIKINIYRVSQRRIIIIIILGIYNLKKKYKINFYNYLENWKFYLYEKK